MCDVTDGSTQTDGPLILSSYYTASVKGVGSQATTTLCCSGLVFQPLLFFYVRSRLLHWPVRALLLDATVTLVVVDTCSYDQLQGVLTQLVIISSHIGFSLLR